MGWCGRAEQEVARKEAGEARCGPAHKGSEKARQRVDRRQCSSVGTETKLFKTALKNNFWKLKNSNDSRNYNTCTVPRLSEAGKPLIKKSITCN